MTQQFDLAAYRLIGRSGLRVSLSSQPSASN
jgi:hypothetical protein